MTVSTSTPAPLPSRWQRRRVAQPAALAEQYALNIRDFPARLVEHRPNTVATDPLQSQRDSGGQARQRRLRGVPIDLMQRHRDQIRVIAVTILGTLPGRGTRRNLNQIVREVPAA